MDQMADWRRGGLVIAAVLSACTAVQPKVSPSTAVAEQEVAAPISTTGFPERTSPVDDEVVGPVAPTSLADNCDPAPNIDEVFGCWERNRRRIVDALTAGIEAGDWGLGLDGVLRGPRELKVDLTLCPDGWSDTAGIDGDTIQLAQISALSGGLGQSSYHPGVMAYVNLVNENGGVGGRQIALSVHDDSFLASATREIVEELLADDEMLAIHTYGSSNTLAVAEMLEEACVSLPFAQAAHPAFGDLDRFSWMVGGQLSINAEIELWLTWLETHEADRLPLSAAAIVMEGYGGFYERAFRDAIGRRPGIVGDFNAVWHDPAEPDIRRLLADVAGFDPDVYIQMTAAHPCLMALQGALEHGLVGNIDRTDRIVITASVCTQVNAFLSPAGDAGNGVLAVGRNMAFANPLLEPGEEIFASWAKSELLAQGLDWRESLNWFGFVDVGWSLVEALRIADDLPGGLSRSNLLLTMHALDLDHPALPPGVAYKTNGLDDRHLIEGGPMMRYDAETTQWVELDTVDVDGQTPPCRWVFGPEVDSTYNQGFYGETFYGQCLPDP